MAEAIRIAASIIAGETSPNDGCSKIGEICQYLGWPKELSAFGLLSHEQYDHENIGITAENCVPEIIAECKLLVAVHS